jgi:hypothetical protein
MELAQQRVLPYLVDLRFDCVETEGTERHSDDHVAFNIEWWQFEHFTSSRDGPRDTVRG